MAHGAVRVSSVSLSGQAGGADLRGARHLVWRHRLFDGCPARTTPTPMATPRCQACASRIFMPSRWPSTPSRRGLLRLNCRRLRLDVRHGRRPQHPPAGRAPGLAGAFLARSYGVTEGSETRIGPQLQGDLAQLLGACASASIGS